MSLTQCTSDAQVVVALLEPLQEGGAVMAAAVQVLETIIIDGRMLMKPQIKALPPLPQSVPALHRVNSAIAEERGKLTNSEHVQLLLQSLGHHSLSVRTTALQVSQANLCCTVCCVF